MMAPEGHFSLPGLEEAGALAVWSTLACGEQYGVQFRIAVQGDPNVKISE